MTNYCLQEEVYKKVINDELEFEFKMKQAAEAENDSDEPEEPK